MQQEQQKDIVAYLQFLSYQNSAVLGRVVSRDDNYFLCHFMEQSLDVLYQAPDVFKLLGIRDSRRNRQRILLPCYTTEKIIDEHLGSILKAWHVREHIGEEELAYLVDNEVDFDSFIISLNQRSQLKDIMSGQSISVNLYTRFVYNSILLEERDYFDNIIGALCKGSRAEYQEVLNNIHNGCSAPSEEELKLLIDAELPYLIEYSDYLKDSVYNSVGEFIQDLENPDIDCSDEDYKEIMAERLMSEMRLIVNGFRFQILEVGVACDVSSNIGRGGRWHLANDGLHILIGSDITKRQGFIVINKICSEDTGFVCEGAEEICRFIHSLMNTSLNKGSLGIRLVQSDDYDYTNQEGIE